jgi:septum site-determining protein MinD
MAEIICMASSKGGSGKTTITATLGTFLARSGRKVLLIDCDEGTHGLTLMYLDEVNAHRKNSETVPLGTFDISSNVDLDDIAASAVKIEENLSLFPARHVFSDKETIPSWKEFMQTLQVIINYHRDDFDFIFLDAQAGISPASKAAMSPESSDQVILASEYDPMSNAGIERLKARLPDELDVGRTWILLNKLLPEFVAKFSEFLSVARYLPPIPWTADVVRAYSRRQLALNFESGNQFTLAALSVLRELLDRSDRELLDEWIELQTQRLREPVEEQIEDGERMLAQMRKLADKELETNTNVPAFVLGQFGAIFSVIFSVVAAILAVSISFFDLTNNKLLINLLTSNSEFMTIFGAAGLVALLSFLMQAWRELLEEGRELSKKKIAKRYGELDELKRRLDELKSLRSAGFEDLINKKAKNSED